MYELSFFLAILYFIIDFTCLFQLVQIIYYRHKWQSFHVAFLIQIFINCLLRAFYFAFHPNFEDIPNLDTLLYRNIFRFVYYLPINVQFSTYSLFVVYYAHLHHTKKEQWITLKKKILVYLGNF